MKYLIMSESQIHNNWQTILKDPDNTHPEIKDPAEWIALAKTGEIKVFGATVVIQNTIPAVPNAKLTSPPLDGV